MSMIPFDRDSSPEELEAESSADEPPSGGRKRRNDSDIAFLSQKDMHSRTLMTQERQRWRVVDDKTIWFRSH